MASKGNILIVEDNDINMGILQFILTEYGFNVVKAWNGKAAIDIISKHSENYFKIIFMDITMPVMDGFEATERIRGMGCRSIPIIFLTANSHEDDIKHAMKSGMTEYLQKPVEKSQMDRVLRKYGELQAG